MSPVKRSVSLAIHPHGDNGRVLLVLRPPDDADLPNAWGLPAASLHPGEDWETACVRAGREKLGVGVEVLRELNRGSLERAGYTLEMRLFEARITSGTPDVHQPANGATQYADWEWGTADELEPAARAGSLCCRLFLSAGA